MYSALEDAGISLNDSKLQGSQYTVSVDTNGNKTRTNVRDFTFQSDDPAASEKNDVKITLSDGANSFCLKAGFITQKTYKGKRQENLSITHLSQLV